MAELKFSHAQGASAQALLDETIGSRLRWAATEWPNDEALVVRHQAVRWTFAELAERATTFSAGLLALGLRPGDRVGIWSPNIAEWAVAQFASATAGLIFVTINPAYRVGEAEYALNKVQCKALILATSHKSSNYIGMLNEMAPELSTSRPGELSARRLPHLRTVVQIGERAPGTFAFDDVYSIGADAPSDTVAEATTSLSPDDPINIQFTSGTTGAPKGATLTHKSILNNAYFSGAILRISRGDRLCLPVPLYHCFGMVLGNLLCMVHGAAVIYPGDAFDPQEVLRCISNERCTALHGVPTMFIAEMEHANFDQFDLSSLRTGIVAGSPCSIEIMRQVISRMGLREITIGYGMTETSPLICQGAPDDTLERRVSSVGQVLPHVEIKVVDERGEAMPVGTPGELWVKGYSVMQGYWGDEEKTRETIVDGWLRTGDLATVDTHGYVNIVGRLKDMVIRGGENIYPREIEDTLYQHSKVKAVQAFGVPDSKFGEQLCVWVQLRRGEMATAGEIRAFCALRLAHFKVPYYVKFVDSFPMTVTGKMRKVEMREVMVRELELADPSTAYTPHAGSDGAGPD